MEYNWDIKKINTLKQKHIELLKRTSGLTKEEKKEIKEQIEKLKQMEEELNPSFISLPTFNKTKYIEKDKLLSEETLNSYWDTPKFIREIIGKAIFLFQEFKKPNFEIDFPKRNLSNKELVELSHHFYQWLPNNPYEQLFLHYTNPNNHFLRFKKGNITATLLGETIFFIIPTIFLSLQ